jgi:hypothetical protein
MPSLKQMGDSGHYKKLGKRWGEVCEERIGNGPCLREGPIAGAVHGGDAP